MQGIDPSSDVFLRIEMKYIDDDQGLEKYFSAFHRLDEFPQTLIVDDFGDFIDQKTCTEKYGNNPRGRDLVMVRTLALCRSAIAPVNEKRGSCSCRLLLSDANHGDSPRLLSIYKRWVPTIFTVQDYYVGPPLDRVEDGDGEVVWEEEELEALSSPFQGRIPQKPGKLNRQRPMPRAPVSKHVYKNPIFLIGIALQISALSAEQDASVVLNKCSRFLRKGSLSLTIKELGYMGRPDRALQTFSWAQKQPGLFPDDRILSSAIEILAKNHELKMPLKLAEFVTVASRSVLAAMVSGFIKGGRLKLALKLLMVAKRKMRTLDASVYTKLILELGKNPDTHMLVLTLLENLAERDDLNLSQQDCTTIMKACISVEKFELVESLFQWYTQSGRNPTVVMYTTLIHSRYSEKRNREALAVVWEMESAECLFDLPACRVVLKLFVELEDLSRASRYFSKLKEAGLSPSYDIYQGIIRLYLASGVFAKCKEVCKEAKMAGFKVETQLLSQLSPIR